MPTVQSTYSDMGPGVAGQIANMVPATLITRNVETAAGIGFGVAVDQGTEDLGVVVGGGSEAPVGITVRERSLDANEPDKFAENDNARIMTKGTLWVSTAVAVAAGDPVHALAAGALSNTGGTQIPNARWETSTPSGGGLAIIRMG